ncbi:MAG: Uma2 family endonuclease [Chloroflexi bacterium]|nr:Uma2 family endonuclease [Chloroflexota bacterium]MYE40695.1 Uma2 family endonuclease [Chloroflexota bacterium]
MTTARPPAIEPDVTLPYRLVLNIRALEITEDQLLKLCSDNGDLRIELTANGELVIMAPAGLESGWQEVELARQVGNWAVQNGTGRFFGSNTGYTLPNGAVRAPDVSWMPLSRWESLSRDDQTKFGHTFPDFAIELRSSSDRLRDVQDKMREYMENGVLLGLLIDPRTRRVHVYRPGQPVDILEEPTAVSGDPVLPGFVLDLSAIW